jgi:16S rRNA processing protein RimM
LRSSNNAGKQNSQDLVVIGQVLRPHALSGLLKVKALTDWPERFKKLSSVSCMRNGRVERVLFIEQVHVNPNALTIKFRDVDDRDTAEKLTGSILAIPKDECLSLPAGEFYAFEIIGLKVLNPRQEEIGTLIDVISFPANDVWMIRTGGKDVLIPATQDFIKSVDPAAGFIVVDRIEEFEE